ncbi:MAG: hypothetical protein ACLFSV_13460 [Alkalispirochaeta sp.]
MVFRRSSSVWIVLGLLAGAAMVAEAQVYPDREYLDVVILSDGTILKGVITERVPERYLEIEVYGGSTFVLAFGQIESVERQPNPDYGTTWIKVDLDALDRAGATAGSDGAGDLSAGESTTARDGPKSLKDGGLVLGLTTGPMVRWMGGPDWDGYVDDFSGDAESEVHFDGEPGGVFFRYLTQPAFVAETPWVLGVRGAIVWTARSGRIVVDDIDGSGETLEYDEHFGQVTAPLELLGGVASDRFAAVAGIGPAIVFLTKTPDYRVTVSGVDFDDGGEIETDRNVALSLVTSLGAIARLRSWQFDLRLYYDRQIVTWTDDREIYPQAVGLSLGVGYRLGR